MSIISKVLTGFQELLPADQMMFDQMKHIIQDVYHQYGYVSIETPVIERSDVLLAKGSEEADKQIYFVQNGLTAKEPNALALRFDLTIPFARYVVDHMNDLSFPFKRSQLDRVYRGERPQKGRFREFYQCDVDVIGKGSLSVQYDAEMPCIIYQIFKKLDIGKFTIRINNRKVLNGFFESIGLSAFSAEVLRIIDKAEKISHEKLLEAFAELGVDDAQVASILNFVGIRGTVSDIIGGLYDLNIDNEQFNAGIDELKIVCDLLALSGVDAAYYTIDLAIARGLDYYTGTVYETTLDDYPIGSVCGGGRYENLAENFTKEKLPGVGISIGLSRLFWQLKDQGLLKPMTHNVKSFVILPDKPEHMALSLHAATKIRDAGGVCDVIMEDWNMKKKLQYATRKDAFYTVVVRDDYDTNDVVISLQYKQGDDFVKDIVTMDALINMAHTH